MGCNGPAPIGPKPPAPPAPPPAVRPAGKPAEARTEPAHETRGSFWGGLLMGLFLDGAD